MRRTIVFLTLDPHTARALRARLAALFDAQVLLQRRHRPPVLLLPDEAARADDLAGLPGAAVLVATAEQYEWAARAAAEPDRLSAVYVRPELMVTADVLQDLWPAGTPEADAWAELLALDRHLQPLPRVMMEDVHGGGTPLWPSLAEALDLPWPEGVTLPPPADGARSQAEALAALLPPRHLAAPLAASRPAGLGRLAVRAEGAGLALLGQGWSHPEAELVWSDGPLATLRLPVPPGRRLAARLHGFLIRHPARAVGVAAWAGEACLATASVQPDGPGEVTLELALPGGEGVVELRFDGPVRPCDVGGPNDARSLGLALQAVELLDAGAAEPPALVPRPALDADAPAFLADPLVAPLFARCRPALVLVLSATLEPGLRAARACLALGAGSVVVSRAVSDPPDPGSLVPAEDADGAPLPGVALLREGLTALPPLLPGRRVALAVLCDEAQTEPFLAACATPGGTATLAGASLVVASGDPYRVGYAVCWYLHAHRLLMRSSDVVTLAGPPG